MRVERLSGRAPAECLAWSAVERGGDCFEILCGMSGEVRSFREVLAKQAVGVLVRASLPWALRVTEIHLQPAVDRELSVLCHLGALVPGERATQLLWECDELGGNRITNRSRATACERRPVLHSCAAVAGQRRQVKQHGETCAALNQRADRCLVSAQGQVALPVTWDCAVLGLG